MEIVVLVDKKNRAIGAMEKIRAHKDPRLHRAISVLLFDRQGRMLLQRRAASKYHGPGLWANACCTHPRLGEKEKEAAHRRLKEELGIVDVTLEKAFSFCYRSQIDGGLEEFEHDTVFFGQLDAHIFCLNPKEVSKVRWVTGDELVQIMANERDTLAPWFLKILEEEKVRSKFF